MKDYADQNYLHARIYAMRGRLLSLKEYTLMAKEAAFTGLTAGMNNYIQTKENTFKNQIAEIISLAGTTRKYRPLFISFLRFYEANNAKFLLARALGRDVLEQWYDIGPYAVLVRNQTQDHPNLASVETLMRNTYLKDAIKDTSSYERIETQVDMCTARYFHNAAKTFSPGPGKTLQDFICRRMATTRMIWQWRLKEYYNWSDEKITGYLEEMYDSSGWQAQEQERIAQSELNTKLERIRRSGTSLKALDTEHFLEQDFYHWISSRFHRDFHSINCVVSYLWLLFYQIRNMFCIIDAKRFNTPPDTLIERLICEA